MIRFSSSLIAVVFAMAMACGGAQKGPESEAKSSTAETADGVSQPEPGDGPVPDDLPPVEEELTPAVDETDADTTEDNDSSDEYDAEEEEEEEDLD